MGVPVVERIRLVLVAHDPAGLGEDSDCYLEEAVRLASMAGSLDGGSAWAAAAHREVAVTFGELAGESDEYTEVGRELSVLLGRTG